LGTKNDTLPGVNKDNISARWTRPDHLPTTYTNRYSATKHHAMRD
jgi:hypothetical protein